MQTESVDVTGAGNEQVSQWTPPSWEEVVREHSGRVYRLAYRLTGNSHDAEDLTQEVFVRVFRSLPTYSPGTFEGWLHRITTNLFLDMTRRRQRIRFEGLGEETAAKLRGAEPTPSQAFDERHLDFDISAALADVLGVKLGTVRSRIHRGRAQLRAALEHRRPRRAGASLLGEVTKPKVTKPKVTKPMVAKPITANPSAAQPKAAQPSLPAPRTGKPPVVEPELARSEVTRS